MRERQGGRIQKVDIREGKVPYATGMNGSALLNLGSTLIPRLLCAGRAVPTSAHTHLTLGPVDLRVVLTKPSEPEDHILFPQARDGKDGALRMCAITQD